MVERQTAIKVTVADLLEGRYVQKEGWDPNYVQTKYGQVSRVNIMGVITQQEGLVLTLDDSTGTINLRTFEEPKMVAIGTPVQVIGKPREYNKELFIVYEIIKPIHKDWLVYRKEELKEQPVIKEDATMRSIPSKEDEGEEIIVRTTKENIFSKLLRIIRAQDKQNNNEGANIETVISECADENAEQVLNNLLEEGEIFEIRPGLIKVLE